MPEISVIIPLYNGAEYVTRAVNSVLEQTYKDYEIIVVDDGSTDNGPEMVRRCKDARLRMIQQENTGPGAARNRGVKESKSRYVAFLDADDEWLPDFLNVSLSNLQNHSDCALSACGIQVTGDLMLASMVESWGIETGPYRLAHNAGPKEIWSAVGFIHSAGNVLCRREIVEEYGGFFENGCTYGEDNFLWLQVILNHTVYRDSRKLMIYHRECSGLTGSGRSSPKNLLPVLLHPESARKVCPEQYKEAFEKYLAYTALKAAHRKFMSGDADSAIYLLEHYPLMKRWQWDYMKLRIKMGAPGLVPIVKWFKQKLPAGNVQK
jgi:GT2 family glycosyltransferase